MRNVRTRLEPDAVRGMESGTDRAQALETVARSFDHPARMERHLARSLWSGSLYRPQHTRVVVAGGRVVSVVVMGPRSVRFGPVRVPAMTIGPVATHEAFRNRGFCAAAMRDAVRHMEDNGVLLAYLAGGRRLYARFGFYPYHAHSGVTLVRADMEREMRPGRLRPLARRDIPRVAALHERAAAGHTMSADRDGELWRWLLGPGTRSWLFHRPRAILDGNGRVRGYLTGKPDAPAAVTELVVEDSEAAMRATLGALARLSRREELKEISVPAPYGDPFAVFIRQCVGGKFSINARGPLLKIVRMPELMRKLEPLFDQRWRESRARRPVRFTLESEIGSAVFRAAGGRVRVGGAATGPRVKVPAEWLSGLLTGYFSVRDVERRRGTVVPAAVRPAMEILFPPGEPYTYRADNY